LESEPILLPEQPILDAHHHLWDRPEERYVIEDLLKDVTSGHDVRATLYVQCRTGYRTKGSKELQPVGEVETILRWGQGSPHHPAGMVAFADLQLGDAVRPVLGALCEAGGGRVRGIRNTTAYHPHPALRSNPRPAPDGLLRTDAFRAGAEAVARAGLCLDVWAYQTQLSDVSELARAVPELTLVVDHCGGPLGSGPFRTGRREHFAAWRDDLAAVASQPNTRIKVGGFGLRVMGHEYHRAPFPPDSATLAADWAPYVHTCIELFGPSRTMFESNFPVDKGQFSYRALWNAFKRLVGSYTSEERHDLFWRSAAEVYGVDRTLFLSDQGRNLS
jgi:L-fuconolactonase